MAGADGGGSDGEDGGGQGKAPYVGVDCRSQISDLKSQISNLKSQISNLTFQISDFRSQISDFKFQRGDEVATEEGMDRRGDESKL
jgi:hypothetical protein